MAEKAKEAKLEREYIIPLREKIRVVPRYKKTNKAIKSIKEFVAKHMKVYDRDLNKIKIDKYVNEFIWARGIRHPPHDIKVKVIKTGEIVKRNHGVLSQNKISALQNSTSVIPPVNNRINQIIFIDILTAVILAALILYVILQLEKKLEIKLF